MIVEKTVTDFRDLNIGLQLSSCAALTILLKADFWIINIFSI